MKEWTPPETFWHLQLKTGYVLILAEDEGARVRADWKATSGDTVLEFVDVTGSQHSVGREALLLLYLSTPEIRERDEIWNEFAETLHERPEPWQ